MPNRNDPDHAKRQRHIEDLRAAGKAAAARVTDTLLDRARERLRGLGVTLGLSIEPPIRRERSSHEARPPRRGTLLADDRLRRAKARTARLVTLIAATPEHSALRTRGHALLATFRASLRRLRSSRRAVRRAPMTGPAGRIGRSQHLDP